jgi:Lysozyme like domain
LPRRLLGALGAVALGLTVAFLAQGGLLAANEPSETNDAKGVRLTPAPAPIVLESEAIVLSSPQTALLNRTRLDPALERQKREAMERNVLAALENVLAGGSNQAAPPAEETTPEATVQATAEPAPEPTPEPTAEPTAEPTVEPTATPTPAAEATPVPEYEAALAEIDAINSGEAGDSGGDAGGDAGQPASYYLSEEFLGPYFGDNWQDASAVMLCESSGNPNAVYSDANGKPLYVGLFQIYVGNWQGQYSDVDLKDPNLNTQLAAELSDRGESWSENWPICGAGK